MRCTNVFVCDVLCDVACLMCVFVFCGVLVCGFVMYCALFVIWCVMLHALCYGFHDCCVRLCLIVVYCMMRRALCFVVFV